MSLPPDDPTRPLPPAGPPVREHLVEEDPAWRQMLLERLDSLRTGLLVVGLVAAAALGVAVWSLVREDDDAQGARGASNERVSAINDRLNQLEDRADKLPARSDVRDLGKGQEDLSKRLEALEEAAEGDSGATDEEARDAIEAINESLGDLDRRVQALEEQSQEPQAQP